MSRNSPSVSSHQHWRRDSKTTSQSPVCPLRLSVTLTSYILRLRSTFWVASPITRLVFYNRTGKGPQVALDLKYGIKEVEWRETTFRLSSVTFWGIFLESCIQLGQEVYMFTWNKKQFSSMCTFFNSNANCFFMKSDILDLCLICIAYNSKRNVRNVYHGS